MCWSASSEVRQSSKRDYGMLVTSTGTPSRHSEESNPRRGNYNSWVRMPVASIQVSKRESSHRGLRPSVVEFNPLVFAMLRGGQSSTRGL